MPSIFDQIFGQSPKMGRQEILTDQQKQSLNQILGQLGQMQGPTGAYGMAQNRLADLLGGGSDVYNAFAAPYMRQFQEQTIPQLAERFAGFGGRGGALSSSGFGQGLGAAGAGLQESLASMGAGLQQNALQQALGQYNTLAGLGLGTRAFAPTYNPGQPGLFGNLFGGLLGGFGAGAGLGFGGIAQNYFGGLGNRLFAMQPRGSSSFGGNMADQVFRESMGV